ncbi:MAG: hypothetical protein PHO09_11280 [Sphaerochaeta sp.]|nr:hypothetical protein [Sphaerochaeta sp.]
MTEHASTFIKPLHLLLTLSLIVGLLFLIGLAMYLIVAPLLFTYQQVNLPVLMQEGLQINLSCTAKSLSAYILYTAVILVTVSFALLFLFFLRKAVSLLLKPQLFSDTLSKSLCTMGWFILLFSYAKQLHLFLYVQQVPNELHEILHFTFTPITEGALYALSFFVLAKVFGHALQLQHEVEQTV